MSITARFFGLLILFVGIGLGTIIGLPYLKFATGSPAQRLEYLWQRDIETLREAKKLPPGFDDIKEIVLIPATDNAKTWIKEIKVPLQVKTEGKHKMEVLMLSFEEEHVLGAIVQYNLVELKSENMIWELGRTFVLEGDPDLEKLNLAEAEPREVESSTAKDQAPAEKK
jgi:hypothetical protein